MMKGKIFVCMAVAGAVLFGNGAVHACENGKKTFDLGYGKKMTVAYEDAQCKTAKKATREDNTEIFASEDIAKVKVQITLQKIPVGDGKIADVTLREKHAAFDFKPDQIYEGDFNPTCRCVSTGGRLFVYCW